MSGLGGYASLVRLAVSSHDFSVLQPLSIKDAIWLEVEMLRVQDANIEDDVSKTKLFNDRMSELNLLIQDLREVLRYSNYLEQITALKETKRPKFKLIEVENLPSGIVAKRKEEQKKTKKEKTQEQNDFVRRLVLNQKSRTKELLMASGKIEEAERILDEETVKQGQQKQQEQPAKQE